MRLLLASALVVVLAAPAWAAQPTRGDLHRVCGFDRNGNGINGEQDPGPDCNVCNGGTLDNGQAEKYVDCTAGVNGSGTAASPYNTLSAAIAAMSAGNIICFKGTNASPCSAASLTGWVGGTNTTVYVRPPSGNEVVAYEYPLRPSMLVGWDKDGDGDYPPEDTDDSAIIDGGGAAGGAFDNGNFFYSEFAHFTIRDYTGTSTNDALWQWGGDDNDSHIYFHDLALEDIDPDQIGSIGMLNLLGSANVDWLAVENVTCTNCGGGYMLARWSAGGQTLAAGDAGLSQYVRFKNLTWNVNCPAGGKCEFWDIFGAVGSTNAAKDGIEWLDSTVDCQLAGASAGTSDCLGPNMDACSTDFTIKNVEEIDSRIFFVGELSDFPDAANAGACDTMNPQRPNGNLVFDSVIHRVPNADLYTKPVLGIDIRDSAPSSAGDDSGEQYSGLHDILVTNSVFYAGGKGYLSAISLDGSHASATCPGGLAGGAYEIYHNDIISAGVEQKSVGGANEGLIRVFNNQGCGVSSIKVKNNIIETTESNATMVLKEASANEVSTWDFGKNIYNSAGSFIWNDVSKSTLALWQTSSGSDANSKESCMPVWDQTNSTAFPTTDFHLDAADTCAIGFASLNTAAPKDFDLELRVSTCDAGADQVVTGAAPTTTTTLPTGGEPGEPGVNGALLNGVVLDGGAIR